MPEIKEYSLNVHWKQGDDFNDHLRECKTVSKALRSWADSLESNASKLRKLAVVCDGKDVEVSANTHMINFSGDESVLENAAVMDLLDTQMIEVDED